MNMDGDECKNSTDGNSDAVVANEFASLACLFDKSASCVQLEADERNKLAMHFDKQLKHLMRTLDEFTFGMQDLQLFLSLTIFR